MTVNRLVQNPFEKEDPPRLLLLLHLLLENLLYNLLLLDEEGTDDAGLHALPAAGTTVAASHLLLALVEIFERNRPEVLDAGKNDTTVTAPCTYSPLGDVVTCELAAGSLNRLGLVRLVAVAMPPVVRDTDVLDHGKG